MLMVGICTSRPAMPSFFPCSWSSFSTDFSSVLADKVTPPDETLH